jgi:plasmid stabilization system protein ParE
MQGIYRLRDYPELGRRLTEFPEANFRQLIIPPYRILYEFADDTVTVLNLIHGYSLFPDDDESEP